MSSGNLMRLAVGMTASPLSVQPWPISRCLTAMATLPLCSLASEANLCSREAGSPPAHQGHKDNTTIVASPVACRMAHVLHFPQGGFWRLFRERVHAAYF